MKKLEPDCYHIILDGRLTKEEIAGNPYVYNDIKEALANENLKAGSKDKPVTVYIAPGVYWVDNPQTDDVITRMEQDDLLPYGCKVKCENLKLIGLSEKAEDIVIAANRGNSHGAKGNYTLFHFSCHELEMQNITLGNYCSVDLVYEANPDLSIKRRTDALTQAQLADTDADKFYAKNCRFISRLNLYPVNGGRRSLYEQCHFEQTDDALNGNAVYVNCDFDLYSGMPIYQASGTGVVFLNCHFHCMYRDKSEEHHQFFTKTGGQVTVVDSAFKTRPDTKVSVSWTKYPDASLKCYQYNITYNEEPFSIDSFSSNTVDMNAKKLLNAYRVTDGDRVVYNTYNLLGGMDDWDPMGVREKIVSTGNINIPTQLVLDFDAVDLQSGGEPIRVTGKCLTFDGRTVTEDIHFQVEGNLAEYVEFHDYHDGSCLLQGKNDSEEVKEVLLTAGTDAGLQASVLLKVIPQKTESPEIVGKPSVCMVNKKLCLSYHLGLINQRDCSDITWYRSEDICGNNKIVTAISQPDKPTKSYSLTKDDVGCYIFATIRPKHNRSDYGEPITCFYEKKIADADVAKGIIVTDFHELPVKQNSELIKGAWTFDTFRPEDTMDFEKWDREGTDAPWHYGITGNGSVGEGLYQGMQGARIRYTPRESFSDHMEAYLEVDPAKTAGQGFGSAGQYFDICIKMDTKQLNGYGLRIIRAAEFSDAVSMYLIKYEHGIAQAVSDKVITSCFVTGCKIHIAYSKGILSANVQTSSAQSKEQERKGYSHNVNLATEVSESGDGGFMVLHTGSLGTGYWQNTTMIHKVHLLYD